MRILYVASDQAVPGTTGGSIHVLEVAQGLAARGHQVSVVVRFTGGAPEREERNGVQWNRVRYWPNHRLFRFRARPAVERLLAELRPHALIERYYNFGGEGVLSARGAGVPALLEVNSPAVDHPGSAKSLLDRALLVHPLRRRRERLLREASAIIAPIPAIVPDFARAKTETVSWGANVEAFSPQRRSEAQRQRLGIPRGALAVLFSGSFRPWHGVPVFEEAARLLKRRADIYFVLAGGPHVGDGRGYQGRRLGAVPYARMPEVVAACDVGVAPYDTSRLRQLRLGFYWSPLKIFEYMASGLPTLTIPRFPLTEIVREGQEGLHVRERDAAGLARAIERLAADAELRGQMGQSARRRVVTRYSWQKHCAQIEGVLERICG